MVKNIVPQRLCQGLGHFESEKTASGAHTANNPSTEICEVSPGHESSSTALTPRLSQVQASAFVTCFLDCAGLVQVVSSPLLHPRQEDLIPAGLRQRFAQVLAEQNPGLFIDPNCFRDSKETRNSQPGPKFSEARARTLESQPIRFKRTLSNETCLAKRRKSGVQSPSKSEDVMSILGGPTIKNENGINTGDEEDSDEADQYVGAGIMLEAIRIDDDTKIWDIIDTRLKQMKQDACRKIAKDWIRDIEPRKQTKYPYNGGTSRQNSMRLHGDKNAGEFTRPPWWCSTEGWKEGIGCRHKEPDHQKKAERLVLVKHILRSFPVAVLQESTKESSRELNSESWNHLQEIYSLRRLQERYKDHEIDGSTIVHVEMPKMPTSSIRKRGVTKLADGKTKEKPGPLLTHTNYHSASMSSNAQAADVILAPSDIKGSELDSAIDSYPPRIPLDKESNELGDFNGADMAYNTPSSSLHEDGYPSTSTSGNTLACTTPGCEDAMSLEHMEFYQSATKNESSPYPDFEHSSGVRDVRACGASADVDMQLCDSDSFGFGNPHIGNAQARNELWNGIEGASSNQASSFDTQNDYACGSSTTSLPQEQSMGNNLSNPPVMDVQTMPQSLNPTIVYRHSHYHKTNLINSTLDPRTIPLDDPLTLGSLVGHGQSHLSEPSRSSMLNMPVQQMSHYTAASPGHLSRP